MLGSSTLLGVAVLLVFAHPAISSVCEPLALQVRCRDLPDTPRVIARSTYTDSDVYVNEESCRSFCRNVGVSQRGATQAHCCQLEQGAGRCTAFISAAAVPIPAVAEPVSSTGSPATGSTPGPTFSPASDPKYSSSNCEPRGGQQQPHILMVVVDDAGFNDFGMSMNNQFSTPVIDRLATNGILLNNHYTMPICGPSRAALHAGRHPIQFGRQMLNLKASEKALPRGFNGRDQMLAERFQTAGYKTYGFGKWHLGHATKEDTPTYNGYNLWFGKLLGGGDHWTHVKSHRWSSCIGDGSNNRAIGYDMRRCQGDALETVYNASGIFTTDLFTMNAVDAIRLHDTKKSAFIYMAYTAPHSPLQAPPAFLDRVSSAYDTLPRRKTIAAMMAGIDSGIDDLITALREKDMWMDTITVVMSDNGGMATGRPAVGQYSPQLEQLVHSNYPLRGFKGGFFEGGTRTVGLLYTYDQHVPYARGWRPLSPAMVGQAFDGIMFIGDWVPTLADAAGLPEAAFAEPDADIDGVSLWSAFADGAPPPRKELLYSVGCKIRIEGSDSNRYNCGAIRVGNLKWIQLRRVKYKEGWSPPDFQSDDARSTLRSRLGLSLGISCPATDHQPDATECIDNPCLFNVRDDPCERNNLAAVLPEDLAHIQARLFELGDKYTQVRESKEFDAEGCTAISSGAWGLWLDQDNHDICQDETGLQRFSFSSNVHPATAADEVVPTNNQHQCALQCLAGSRCTGFFFEPEVVDANARVDLANIAGSLNQDWIGAPEGSCHLYRPQITLETMVAASTGGFYSLTSCNRRCNGPMLERFRAYPKTRPKWASRFMSTVAGVTLEACAQECVGTFGCKSFTFKPSTAVIGSTRCQLYEKVFRTALLVDHASKDYYTKRGDCMDPCPLNQIERFVRLPQSRPRHQSAYTVQTQMATPDACAAACLAVGLARCLSFTWYTDTTNPNKAQQCRFYDRRSGPSFIAAHDMKDYYVLIFDKCFKGDGLSIASFGNEDAREAEDDELEDYSWMNVVDEPSYHFPLRMVGQKSHPKRKYASQDGPTGASEEPEAEFQINVLVPIAGAVTMVIAMSMIIYAAKRRKHTHAFNEAADEPREPRPTSTSSSSSGAAMMDNLHNTGTGTGDIELIWDATVMEDCSTAVSNLVCDLSLVQGGALSPDHLARHGFVVSPTEAQISMATTPVSSGDDSDSSSSDEETACGDSE